MKNLTAKLQALIQFNKIYFRRAKGLFIYNLFNAIVIGPCISVAGIVMIQLVMNALIDGRAKSYIVFLVIALTGAQLIGNLVQLTIAYFFIEKINLKVRLGIARDFSEKIKQIDLRYLDDPGYLNALQYVGNNLANKVTFANDTFMTLISNISTIVAVCSIVVKLKMPVIICISLVYSIIATVIRNKMTKIGFQKNQEYVPYERRCDYCQWIFKNRDMAQDLRCTNLSGIVLDEFDKSAKAQENVINKYVKRLSTLACGDISTSGVLSCFCLVCISLFVSRTALSQITALPTLFDSYRNLSRNLNSIFRCDSQLIDIAMFYQEYNKLMNIECVIENTVSNHDCRNDFSKPFDIEFQNVYFTYPNSNFALQNFNLHINAGETIGIVGANGAGKTTLTKLLLRLYDVNDGDIYINGDNIKDLDLAVLRNHIGYAPQSINLYSFSFRQNLSLYSEYSSDDESKLLKEFDFNDIFDKFHGNIESQVTKQFDAQGIMLSGGETQKLSIARIFKKQFGLLIFDEPTAALDPISERNMTDTINKMAAKSTAIIVAHRLSTIKNVNRIIVLENGKIIESGTHDELIRLNGKYKEMYYAQGENYQFTV